MLNVGFSLVVKSGDHSLVVVLGLLLWWLYGLLGSWASVVAARGLSSCGSQTPEHRLNSVVHGLVTPRHV